MIRRGGFRGLLYPKVAVEHTCWNPEQFLEETCMKAGLYPRMRGARRVPEILGFTAEIFSDNAAWGKAKRALHRFLKQRPFSFQKVRLANQQLFKLDVVARRRVHAARK